MAKKLPPFGKSKKHRLRSGETWTVLAVKPGNEKKIGLKAGDRFRLEKRTGFKDANMFPEQHTQLFEHKNEEIGLEIVRDSDTLGITYKFEITMDGGPTTLWLQEGGDPQVAGSEAEICDADPTTMGGGGGVATIRR